MPVNTYPSQSQDDLDGLPEENGNSSDLRNRLDKVNTELDKFIYSTSHDFRAPLVSIQGLVDLLQAEDPTEEHSHYLELMQESIRKLDHYIRAIGQYATNKHHELSTERIFFEDAIDTVMTKLEDEKIDPGYIDTQIEIDLHEPFYSDPIRVNLILYHLLANAFTFSKKREFRPYIQVKITSQPDMIKIVLADNGIGIPLDHQRQVFEMFHRASPDRSGIGMGLFIVRETANKLGGSIQLRSIVGEGSTFKIVLPNCMQ